MLINFDKQVLIISRCLENLYYHLYQSILESRDKREMLNDFFWMAQKIIYPSSKINHKFSIKSLISKIK
ncbi:hypothetical protein BpHYR1_033292 [Brachionus plicatilis]|uniref:Uncharacterized protein n=1 Tax=Brachionus plicatilis TaxID=10195 RepID=A0A3M7R7M2_BRAPC|nr:hypothetical protein BpHYR1_033292 [Brachionus plicatilis]